MVRASCENVIYVFLNTKILTLNLYIAVGMRGTEPSNFRYLRYCGVPGTKKILKDRYRRAPDIKKMLLGTKFQFMPTPVSTKKPAGRMGPKLESRRFLNDPKRRVFISARRPEIVHKEAKTNKCFSRAHFRFEIQIRLGANQTHLCLPLLRKI